MPASPDWHLLLAELLRGGSSVVQHREYPSTLGVKTGLPGLPLARRPRTLLKPALEIMRQPQSVSFLGTMTRQMLTPLVGGAVAGVGESLSHRTGEFKIGSNGLWSVMTVKWSRPARKRWHFRTAPTRPLPTSPTRWLRSGSLCR